MADEKPNSALSHVTPSNGAPNAQEGGESRLELARRAYREFHASCFWSYREDAEITEEKIPWVMQKLREHGGLRRHFGGLKGAWPRIAKDR